MKKQLLKTIFLLVCIFGFFSCQSDDNDGPSVELDFMIKNAYILNQGKWGANDADLAYYNNTGTFTNGVFENQNKDAGYEGLGDTGQDLLIYGAKMYITVTESNITFVTDLKGKLLKRDDGSEAFIQLKNESDMPLNPHSLIAHNGKVYVSMYGGYVAQIDTATLRVEKKVAVGAYPERMTIVDNKLYVVNTRSKANTVSVINLSNFTVANQITVVENPTGITNDNYGNIYIISMGNYDDGDIKPTLQKIAANTATVSTIGINVATTMAIDGDRLLLIYKDPMGHSSEVKLSYYDIPQSKLVDKSFVADNIDLSNATGINIDFTTHNIYILMSDYVNTGSINMFSANGTYIKNIKTGGYNPVGIYFITQESK